MKNFRKAALALATASSVALAGTAVAGAEAPADNPQSLVAEKTTDNASGSTNIFWKFGEVLGAHNGEDSEVTGADLFGSTQGKDMAAWSQLFKWGWVAAVTGTIIGIGIGIANELKNKGIII